MKFLEKTEAYFAPIGRIVMGAFFTLSGVSKTLDLSGTATYIDSVGLPAAGFLAFSAAVFEILVGTSLLIGHRPKLAALLLAGYTLLITFPFHGPQVWHTSPTDQAMFMKNIVIAASLLFMAAHAGKFSDYNQNQPSKQSTPRPTL